MEDQYSFISGIEILDQTLANSTIASIYTSGGISILATADSVDLNNGGNKQHTISYTSLYT